VEILIVVVLLGIIAAIVVPRYAEALALYNEVNGCSLTAFNQISAF